MNKEVEILVAHEKENFDDLMSVGLQPLADAMELDRIVVYRFFDTNEGKRLRQSYRWDRAAGGTTFLNEDMKIVSHSAMLVRWLSVLSENDCINLQLNEASEDELNFLNRFNIKSILIVPIFTHGEFWGGITFQDHKKERRFCDDCNDLFRAAARVCANAVIRMESTNVTNETIAKLEKREKMTTILNKMSVLFLSRNEISFEITMTEGIKLIADALNLDRVSVWRNSIKSDGLHGAQVYRWDREAGGTSKPTKGLEDASYAQLAPKWAKVFTNGGEINTPARFTTGREYETLKTLGCVSTFFTPIFIGGSCWGFVLFEDRQNERFFEESDVEIMRSAALLCTNTVIRAEMEQEIIKVNEQLSNRLKLQVVTSEIMKKLIGNAEIDELLRDTIEKIGNCLNVSRVVIVATDRENNVVHIKNIWYAADAPKLLAVSFKFMDFFTKYFPVKLSDTNAIMPPVVCEFAAESEYEEFKEFASIDIGGFVLSPIYIEGKLWGFLNVEQCNSSRVWTESEIKFAATAASAVSNVIMRELYNSQSKESLKKAIAASKAKSEFLSNMSHEIRTPINSIVGMTTIGKNSCDIGRKDYCFSKIENASKHLLGIINDILDMSKIESNKFELSSVEFSFEKMLKRVADFINFRVSEKQQKFTVRIDKFIPKTLVGDDQRLAQIITNLLSNAVKFTPEKGSIHLDARFFDEKDGFCTIQIRVSDTGIGIDKKQQETLFDPFKQAESSTTRKFGGTGLGLSISKSVVELMNGEIWFESEPDKGSTFTFTAQLKCGKDESKSVVRGVNWSNVKILAVDDDPVILTYFQEILQRYGVNCDTASNGEEALKIAKQKGAYNIYFLDWQMPEMDGIKLIAELKKSGYADSEKSVVIMISSAELGVIEEKAKKAGIDKFLTKPLFSSEIMDVLNEFLGVEQQQADEKTSKPDGVFADYHILLVEDVKINCEILLALFEPTLLKIDCAENGLEAVEMFAESSDKYDLIFMDLQMPEMDGYEATKRIRTMNIDKAKNIPIIAMTANVFKEDIEKCLAIGMNDHVGKPIDFDDVLEKMKKYLPKKGR
ncbi:MAG: response regulator [Chitinispirillales bacterium]|nr:response regulator [Chitinispirillales bacterium]